MGYRISYEHVYSIVRISDFLSFYAHWSPRDNNRYTRRKIYKYTELHVVRSLLLINPLDFNLVNPIFFLV